MAEEIEHGYTAGNEKSKSVLGGKSIYVRASRIRKKGALYHSCKKVEERYEQTEPVVFGACLLAVGGIAGVAALQYSALGANMIDLVNSISPTAAFLTMGGVAATAVAANFETVIKGVGLAALHMETLIIGDDYFTDAYDKMEREDRKDSLKHKGMAEHFKSRFFENELVEYGGNMYEMKPWEVDKLSKMVRNLEEIDYGLETGNKIDPESFNIKENGELNGFKKAYYGMMKPRYEKKIEKFLEAHRPKVAPNKDQQDNARHLQTRRPSHGLKM